MLATIRFHNSKIDQQTRIRIPARNEFDEPWKPRELREWAIDRASQKLFGKNCFFWHDSGLAGYGQVMEALRPTKANSQPGNSAVTMRIAVDVDIPGMEI